MDRIFHKRFTLAAKSYITVFALLVVYLFWIRGTINILLGLVFVIYLVFFIESVINTTYKFTDDGLLVIDKGRFSKKQSIPVNEIIKASKRSSQFKFSRYILLEYGANKTVSVLPEDEEAFMDELVKRQHKVEETLI